MSKTLEEMERELAHLESKLKKEKEFSKQVRLANVAKNREDRERVMRGERCLHNMVFEYCAVCQAVKYTESVKFPVEFEDEDTGEIKEVWMKTKVVRTSYKSYR